MRHPHVLLALVLAWTAAARADHPMLTEDADVLGKGVWQLELHGEAIRDERDPAAAVLSHGIAPSVDLQLELARSGDDSLALKWRFHEAGPLKLVAKPELTDSGWGASFVAGYEIGAVELLGHLGYARADGESLRHASAALLLQALSNLKVVLDFARDTNPGRDTHVLGLIYALARDIDLGFGRKAGDERAWLFGAKLRW